MLALTFAVNDIHTIVSIGYYRSVDCEIGFDPEERAVFKELLEKNPKLEEFSIVIPWDYSLSALLPKDQFPTANKKVRITIRAKESGFNPMRAAEYQ